MTDLLEREAVQEIVPAQTQEAQLPVVPSSNSFLDAMMQVVRDPTIDANKVDVLARVAIQLKDKEHEMLLFEMALEYNKAKHAALSEMPRITKTGAITNKEGKVQSRYSKFEDIMHAVKPILQRHSLCLTFEIAGDGRATTVTPMLSHFNGHVERGGAMTLPIDTSGAKNATQGVGSSNSYGMRYAARAMLNIVEEGEDTDGRAAQDDGVLNKAQLAILEGSRMAAAQGMEAYNAWWAAQSSPTKRLVMAHCHGENKATAQAVQAQAVSSAPNAGGDALEEVASGTLEHPALAKMREFLKEIGEVRTIMDLNSLRSHNRGHLEAMPDEYIKQIEQAFEKRTAKLKGE
jgi:ERF superfamily